MDYDAHKGLAESKRTPAHYQAIDRQLAEKIKRSKRNELIAQCVTVFCLVFAILAAVGIFL